MLPTAYRGYNRLDASRTAGRPGPGSDNGPLENNDSARRSPAPGRIASHVARVAHRGQNLPPGTEPGLEASRTFDPADFTIPFGVYIAVVEVMPETGDVQLQRFIGVDDVGTVINPLLLEGSRRGSPRRSSSSSPAV